MKRWTKDAYCMFPNEEGEWIKYSDVAEALNIVEELAEQNRPKESIRNLIRRAKAFKGEEYCDSTNRRKTS